MEDEFRKCYYRREEKCKAVIVVPLYTSNLTPFENISLMQLYDVLGKHPICYVMPERMREEFEESALWVEYFPNQFFQSVQSYSRLCLESFFYSRFENFDYMLIYQPDAFVFRDELHDWCTKGYDYVGAPWPWLLLQDIPKEGLHWHRVGNGGFSLRRIAAMLRVLARKHDILASYSIPERLLNSEDLFWAYCASSSDSLLAVPEEREAQLFSLEGGGERYVQKLTEKKIPFGCHGWCNLQYGYLWKTWIERSGYQLKGITSMAVKTTWHKRRRYVLETAVLRRWQKYHQKMLPKILSHIFGCLPEKIALWGHGKYGEIVQELFSIVNVPISCIYDQKARKGDGLNKVYVLQPPITKRLMQTPILISTLKYEDEIGEELSKAGYIKNKDYFFFSDVLHALFDAWPVFHYVSN